MCPDDLNALRVIRQYRLHRVERQMNAQRRGLDALDEQIAKSRQAMETASVQYGEQRRVLGSEHQNTTLCVSQLKQWGQQEKQLIEALNTRQRDIDQLLEDREEQRVKLDETRRSLKARRLGLEKLDALHHMIQEV